MRILNLSHQTGSTQVLPGDKNTLPLTISLSSIPCPHCLSIRTHAWISCLENKLSPFWLIYYYHLPSKILRSNWAKLSLSLKLPVFRSFLHADSGNHSLSPSRHFYPQDSGSVSLTYKSLLSVPSGTHMDLHLTHITEHSVRILVRLF